LKMFKKILEFSFGKKPDEITSDFKEKNDNTKDKVSITRPENISVCELVDVPQEKNPTKSMFEIEQEVSRKINNEGWIEKNNTLIDLEFLSDAKEFIVNNYNDYSSEEDMITLFEDEIRYLFAESFINIKKFEKKYKKPESIIYRGFEIKQGMTIFHLILLLSIPKYSKRELLKTKTKELLQYRKAPRYLIRKYGLDYTESCRSVDFKIENDIVVAWKEVL